MPVQHIETIARKLSTEVDAPRFAVAHGVVDGEFQFAAISREGKTIYLDRNELIALIETALLVEPDIALKFASEFAEYHGIPVQ